MTKDKIAEARDREYLKLQEIETYKGSLVNDFKEEVCAANDFDTLDEIIRNYGREFSECRKGKALREESIERLSHEYDIASAYPLCPSPLLHRNPEINIIYSESGEPRTFDGDVCDFMYVFCGYENDTGKPIELYVELNPYDYGYYDDYYYDDNPYTDYDEDLEMDDLEKMLYSLAEECGIDSSKFVMEWDV